MFDSAINGLVELIRAAADAEFRTVAGLANFVLTLAAFAAFTARAPLARVWNLLMWVLDRSIGSAPEPPQPAPALPSLQWMLCCTLGGFTACVATIGVAA